MVPNPEDGDPLWRLRHALTGMALALLLSMLVAAVAGSAIGGDYGRRVTAYLLLLAHVLIGAGVLFVKVARHETRPLTPGRVLRWFASLWLWPLLLLAARRHPPDRT